MNADPPGPPGRRLFSRRWLTTAALLMVFVAAVGIAPHAWYSLRAGELSYFKSAYDEDTYVRLWLLGQSRHDRVVSDTAFSWLHAACGGNLVAALVKADAVFPAAAALGAFVLASLVVRSASARLLLALLLLFGQELLSFGSSAVTWLLPGRLSLAAARLFVAASHPGLIPDYSTSYFSLFRTPEPQVSLCLVLLHMAGVVALILSRGSRRVLLPALAVSHGLVVYGYAFLAVTVVLTEALLVLALACVRRFRTAGELLLTMLPLSAVWVSRGTLTFSERYIFPSSGPVLTPAVIYSVLLLLAFGLAWRRGLQVDVSALPLVPVCALAPLLLMNQQTVTGIMLSTRDFERYSNYPVLVLGGAILVSALVATRRGASGKRHIVTASAAALMVVVALGEWNMVAEYRSANDASMAMARTIEKAVADPAAPRRVLLQEVAGVPLVALRLHGRAPVEFVLDYTEISRRALPSSDGTAAEREAARFHRARLFEYLARTGESPAGAAVMLGREADVIGTGSAFLLHFLFHLSDVWYPFSDGRRVRPEFVKAALPGIVGEYEQFLAEPDETLTESVLYVAPRHQTLPAWGTPWDYRWVAESTAPGAPDVAYAAFVQSRVGQQSGHVDVSFGEVDRRSRDQQRLEASASAAPKPATARPDAESGSAAAPRRRGHHRGRLR